MSSHRLRTRRSRRLVAAAGALVAAAGISSVLGASGATAAPAATNPNTLIIVYSVKGSTTVARSNVTVPLGPTTITATLHQNRTFDASLPLPPKHVSFLAFGYLPVSATVIFTQVGPATGMLNLVDQPTQHFEVSSRAQYVVTLKNVVVGGQAAKVGPNCQSRRPVTVDVATPAGKSFDLDKGGPLTGTYGIGIFENCGTSTDLTNILVPGKNNTIGITLSNGRIQPQSASTARRAS